jgi:zinc protease
VLPNGLTILLREARLAPVVECQIWARVGSADERDHERGLAHFHEHMLFKGTERRGVGEVAGDIEGAGGRINAYTTYDVTVYHATLPSDRLETGLDVLSDAVLHSAFDAAEIEREIDVVLEEIRRGDDTPGNVIGNAVFADTFRVHPYGKPIIGTADSVSSFDRAKVRAFYERWYTPENLSVVIVGDIDSDAVRERVRETFGSLPRGGALRKRPTEPIQQGLRTRVLRRPFERATIEFAQPAVGLSHPDTPYLDLVAYVAGGCDSSRLVQRVKEREGLADRIDAWSYTPFEPGVFSVDIDADVERAEEAITATVRELERLRVEPIADEELEKARTNFLAMEHFERESVSGMAAKLGSFHTTGGDHRLERGYLESVRTATPADLQRVAKTYLATDRLTIGVLLPDAADSALDDDAVARAVSAGVERTRHAFSAPRTLGRAQIHDFELACGARLHVLPRREVPVVAARAAFMGGLLAESEATSGITAFLASMWMRGTESHSAASFASAVEMRAAEIDSFSGRSSFGLTLEAPSEALAPTLDLFAEVLLEPAFEAQEFERERQDTLAAIERRGDRLAQLAFQLFTQQQFLSHPYRMPTLGSEEVVRALDRESVRAHHDRLTRGRNLVIGVAGDVDPDDIALALSTRLAALESGPFEPLRWTPEPAPTEIRRATLHKDRAQAHLVIGFRGIRVDDDDRFALEVLSQLLAGQGGRLFLELRDRKGLAYSVNAASIEGVAPGYFALYIATAPERLEEARAGLLDELRRSVDAPPTPEELERARRHLVGTFAIDQQRNAAHAAQMALNGLYGLGADQSFRYPEQVEAVSGEDVLRAARRIIDLDAYSEAVVSAS